MMWRAVIFWIITFGWSVSALSQVTTSRLGRFSVNDVKGCAPFTVNVNIIAPFVCNGANPCDMDYEGTNVFRSLTFTHTYTQPGTYLLKILFQTSGFDDIPITVTPNIPPQFDVYTCGNNAVSVKLNDSNYDEYVINYNDGSPEVTVNGTGSHNYSYGVPTPQTITVRGRNFNADDNCSTASKNITPLVTLPTPVITRLEVLDNNRIRLAFTGQPNIQYKLEVATNNATTFQQAKTLYNTTVDTVLNLTTDNVYYCFRISAFDPCNNFNYTSPVICSTNFDLTVRNNAMDLTWTTNNTGISGYRLIRNGSNGSIFQTSPTGSPHTDMQIVCGRDYCYQLTTLYGNGSESISMSKCGTGTSTDTPTVIRDITAMVGVSSVILEWQTDVRFTPAEFSIEKSVQGVYSAYASITQQSFADVGYRLEDESCYRISYADVCGNKSPVSLQACPIRLSGNLEDDNATHLAWTPYAGWANGVAGYRVEKYSEGGQLLRTFDVGQVTFYTDNSTDVDDQTFLYSVKATPVDPGLRRAASNTIAILKNPNIFYPSAFTPNGDNLNDAFTVFGQYVVSFEMKIFNRWGELLFITNEIEKGWDGTFRGNDMPEGTYTFIAHLKDRSGRTFKQAGSVLLLRKQ